MQTYRKTAFYIVTFALLISAVALPIVRAEGTETPGAMRQRMTVTPKRDTTRSATLPTVNPTSIVATIRATTCNSILGSVKARESSLVESVTRLVQRLSTLTDSVNTYYQNTRIPQGKTIANYTELLTNVNTKKAAVESALKTLKDSVTNFNCQNTEVNTHMSTYRADMQKLLNSVREYTTAVKTFVRAVRPLTEISPTRTLSPSTTPLSPTVTINSPSTTPTP